MKSHNGEFTFFTLLIISRRIIVVAIQSRGKTFSIFIIWLFARSRERERDDSHKRLRFTFGCLLLKYHCFRHWHHQDLSKNLFQKTFSSVCAKVRECTKSFFITNDNPEKSRLFSNRNSEMYFRKRGRNFEIFKVALVLWKLDSSFTQ